jgi:NADPH:quinone reductase-like Zn-dependent oxidoreductase
LYQSLNLPLPFSTDVTTAEDQRFVLIYGGATATGTLAIQLARLSGMRVITTCRKKNMPWLKGLGSSDMYDYVS